MKKINFILAAFAAVFALSCNKEITNVQTPDASVPAGMKMVTLTAGIDAAESKTTYDANGKFSWTKGDQISVFASDKNFYTFTADQTGATSTFTGYIPEEVSLRNDYAFFPADPGHRREGNAYYYSIASEKDLSAAFSADLPMGAIVEDGVYMFRHMTGASHFTFTNVPDGIDAVEIAFQSSSIQISGEWETFHGTTTEGDKYWAMNPQNATTDSQKLFIRKVSVVDNTAEVYLPYPAGGTIWGGGVTLTVTGFDKSYNEIVLLKERSIKKSIGAFERAHVIPIASLELPLYLPLAVDWDDVNVATAVNDETATSDLRVKELKAIADEDYMYVRMKSPVVSPLDATHIDIALSDGEGENQVWWGWNTTGTDTYWKEHEGVLDVDGNLTEMVFSYNGAYQNIDCNTVISDNMINWYFAFPREYIDVYKSSENTVYIGFLLWNGYDSYWAIPARWGDMLEVTLP